MTNQMFAHPAITFNFHVVVSEGRIYASSRDFGFDFDEEEIARELLSPLPADPSMLTIPEVEADEFEKVFQYFLS